MSNQNAPSIKKTGSVETLPPELHCMMGATNHKLELLRKFLEDKCLEDKLWTWCDGQGVTRRGYNGKNRLDGNNSSRFLSKMMSLKQCIWFPTEAEPILDCLFAFKEVKDKCFGWELKDGWKESIKTYNAMFLDLQHYAENVLDVHLTVTWKIHVVVCHLETFLDMVRVDLMVGFVLGLKLQNISANNYLFFLRRFLTGMKVTKLLLEGNCRIVFLQ